MKKITIAIDGYSSCGKSTMARALARAVGYVYVDTGAMYRAVTLAALRAGLFAADGTLDAAALDRLLPGLDIHFRLNAATGAPDTYLGEECVEREIRAMEVSSHVSQVATLPTVRREMVRRQQAMGRGGGVVMDGRDIGTVVFPHAELKIFVTADAEVRARRRHDELVAKGSPADMEAILANVRQRDYIDTHREASPLRQAPDAVVLDNGAMTIEEQDRWLMEQFHRVAGN